MHSVFYTLPHTNAAYCCCETCPSAALPGCCLLVCFRGSAHPLECDLVRATVAAELNCPALWSNQKHTQRLLPRQRRQQSISSERRHCREGLLPRELGQLLLVKDCIWQADLDRCFHSEYCCATRTNTHTRSFPPIFCTPLFSTHSLACELVVVTTLYICGGLGGVEAGSTGREKERLS